MATFAIIIATASFLSAIFYSVYITGKDKTNHIKK